MYNGYFGFSELPFSVAPDPRFLYQNSICREALAALRYGIEARKGLIIVSGETGTGKTTLLKMLVSSLGAHFHAVSISNPRLNFPELLQAILRDLGVARGAGDRSSLTSPLNDYLLERLKENHIVALLIDEAQDLSDEMLEEIRLLSNLETDREKLLQIVLIGSLELETRLDQTELWQLKQRVALRCRLASLSSLEVGPYIDSRLRIAGYTGGELFDSEAVKRIASYSNGIPRLVNVICDNALTSACAAGERKVSSEIIEQAARDLQLRDESRFENEFFVAGFHMNEAQKRSFQSAETERVAIADEFPQRGGVDWRAVKHVPRDRLRPGSKSFAWAGTALGVVILVTGSLMLYQQPANQNQRRSSADLGSVPALPEVKKEGESETGRVQGAGLRNDTEKDPAATGSRLRPFETDPVAVRPKQNRVEQGRREKTEPRPSKETLFEVTGASFVRDKPQSDAEIIASLKPGTQVRLVARRGEYLQIRSLNAAAISGYVHREDAFFERLRIDPQPSAARSGK